MQQFKGHEQNWQRLLADWRANRLAGAYLFYGLSGIGKAKVARAFASFVACEKKESGPCGLCSGCLKAASYHPDIFFLEVKEDKKEISVEQVRELQKAIKKAPLEASHKLVIIPEAENLNRSSANTLLKTLEEPPPFTIFILVAPQLFGVLPTIRSRCRRLHFMPPSSGEVMKLLQEKSGELKEDQWATLLDIANGSPGTALRLAQPEFLSAFDEARIFLNGKSSFKDISSSIDSWVKGGIDLFFLLEALKKRVFKWILKTSQLDGIDHLEKINIAQKDIDTNINKQLALESLFLSFNS